MMLTIYIPTYQRPDSLNQLLSVVAPQITDGVEIIVSDNDGDAAPIVARYSHVQYIKRWQNIGCDGNCLAGLSEGSGEYVWVLGDDDLPSGDAVEYILGELGIVDRLILTAERSGEYPAGFLGTMTDLYHQLTDKSFLVASTLCSMNVWRYGAMDAVLGLRHLDSRNVLAWAGLNCNTVKVADRPTMTVNRTNLTSFNGWASTMNQYVLSLCSAIGVQPASLRAFNKWNYTNVG